MWSLIDEIGIVGLVLAIAAMFGGAAAQASIGMGLNLFTVGILALINPVFVPAPILMHSFVLSVVASVRLRKDINFGEVYLFVLGLIIGTLLAASVLAVVSLDHLPKAFGLIIIVGVTVTALGAHLPLTKGTIVAASTAAGIMGTIAGVHGPPIALVYHREKPARIRAALLPFFAIANPLSLLALASVGQFGWREVYASILLLPGLTAGYLFAPVLIRALSPAIVRAATASVGRQRRSLAHQRLASSS
jgi:uncharacterized membrane protein YfcA